MYCVPGDTCLAKVARFFYWFLAIPLCGLCSLLAMCLHGHELRSADGRAGPLFVGFTILTSLFTFQVPLHYVVFVPARLRKEWSDAILQKVPELRRRHYYKRLFVCNGGLAFSVTIQSIMLAVIPEEVSPVFFILFLCVVGIHGSILTARLVSLFVYDNFEQVFYMPFWEPIRKKLR